MPDNQRIIDEVTGRLPKRGCPACGARQWEVQPNVFISNLYLDDKRSADAERGAPVVVAVCGNCGVFLTYGAVRLGLVDPDTE